MPGGRGKASGKGSRAEDTARRRKGEAGGWTAKEAGISAAPSSRGRTPSKRLDPSPTSPSEVLPLLPTIRFDPADDGPSARWLGAGKSACFWLRAESATRTKAGAAETPAKAAGEIGTGSPGVAKTTGRREVSSVAPEPGTPSPRPPADGSVGTPGKDRMAPAPGREAVSTTWATAAGTEGPNPPMDRAVQSRAARRRFTTLSV